MRSHTHRARLIALLLMLGALASFDDHVFATTSPLATGDLVFVRSSSAQSEAIAAATGSTYTHVGLVLLVEGRPMVLEASRTVRLTPYPTFVAHGIGGHVVVKRLDGATSTLDAAARARLTAIGRGFIGVPYDVHFAWSDDAMYCSELAYKVLERSTGVRVGELRRADAFDLDHILVRRLIARRFRRTPFSPDEPVISPGAMFADPRLVTRFVHGADRP